MREDNNLAINEFLIAGESGVLATVELDGQTYGADQDVGITTTIINGSSAFSGRTEILIEDSAGYLVEMIESNTVSELQYGEDKRFETNWNTSDIFAGSYRAVVKVYDNIDELILTEQVVFSIHSNSELTTNISTDQLSYPGNSDVVVTGIVNYTRGNEILYDLNTKIEILSNSQSVIAETDTHFIEIQPGITNSISLNWNTGNFSIEDYQIRISVYQGDILNGLLLSESTDSFSIVSSGELMTGTITVDTPLINSGSTVRANYEILNDSNILLSSVTYEVKLSDVTGQTLFENLAGFIDLGIGEKFTSVAEFDTGSLAIDEYLLSLIVEQVQPDGSTVEVVLDTVKFDIQDRVSPTVLIVTPLNNSVIALQNSIVEVEAKDNLSNIDYVEIDFESSGWERMQVDTQVADYYRWPLPTLIEGIHNISVRAIDTAGNLSEIIRSSFEIDLTVPTITFSQVTDGGFYNLTVSPMVEISDPNLISSEVTLNGEVFLSGDLVSAEGSYQLVAKGVDSAGNTVQQQLQFTIDLTVPLILITGVEEGTNTNQTVVPEIVVSDLYLTQQSTTLNGVTFDSQTAITEEGSYQLTVDATDLAGNQASTTVNFVIDKTAPAITITGITDGAHSSVDVSPQIVISDALIATQTITLNGSGFVSGTLISDESRYELIAQATDQAGNQSTVTVVFTIDKSSPEVTISGIVDGETYLDSVTPMITIVENNLAIQTISLNGGAFTSGTEISVDGSYVLIVYVQDLAGNITELSVNFAIDQTAPVISITGVSDGDFYSSDISATINISEANLVSQSILLDGVDYVSGDLIVNEKEYLLSVMAEDIVGNTAAQTISFVIDKTNPMINVSGVIDGGVYQVNVIPSISISDDYPESQTIDLNGIPFVSGNEIIAEGLYELRVEAVDKAGNISSTQVNFEIQHLPPELSIVSPLNESIVSSNTIDIIGSTSPNIQVILTDQNQLEFEASSDETGEFIFSQIGLDDGVNQFILLARGQNGLESESLTLNITKESGQLLAELNPAQGLLVWLPRHGGDKFVTLLTESLENSKVEVKIVRSEWKFVWELRSQKYSRVILASVGQPNAHNIKHSKCPRKHHYLHVSRMTAIELQAMTASGLGIGLIKGRPRFSWFMKDVFSSRMNRGESNYNLLDISGNDVFEPRTIDFDGTSTSYQTLHAQTLVRSVRGTILATIHEYYLGKTALTGFNPLDIVDREQAKIFLQELVSYLQRDDQELEALSNAAFDWTAKGLTYPADIQLRLNLPAAVRVDNLGDGSLEAENTVVWNKHISASEALFKLDITLPELAGDYVAKAGLELNYSGNSSSAISKDFYFTISEDYLAYKDRLAQMMLSIDFGNCSSRLRIDGSKANHSHCMYLEEKARYLVESAITGSVTSRYNAYHRMIKLLFAYKLVNKYAVEKEVLSLIGAAVRDNQSRWRRYFGPASANKAEETIHTPKLFPSNFGEKEFLWEDGFNLELDSIDFDIK